MADLYIEVPITTDDTALADQAVENLQTEWDGWEPNEGDLDVVMIEVFAHMVGDAALTASQVPSAVFQTIAEDLHGVAHDDGTPATTTVTFSLIDTGPYTITADTEIDIDGWAFTVDQDTAATAVTVPNVPVTASENGAAANGLGDTAVMITALSFVSGVTVDAPTENGSDPETDDEYRDKVAQQLELQAFTLVTTRDYELMALSLPAVARVLVISDTTNRLIKVTASTVDGNPLATYDKDTLTELYEDNRQATWTVQLLDATKTTIDVAYTVKLWPNADIEQATSDINTILDAFLDPSTWGSPTDFGMEVAATGTWLLEPKVRKNKIIDAIGDVPAVNYVVDVTLTGSAGSRDANGDWSMPGTVPLAAAGNYAPTVS